MAAIFGEGKIFGKLQRLHSLDPLWVENFAEIALSRTVKEIEANLCFAIFGKNSKIQNGRHFWGGENFWKIAKIAFLRSPVRDRAISSKFSTHRVSKECNICNFQKNFPSPKMAAILNFRIFAKNGKTQICFYLLNRAR